MKLKSIKIKDFKRFTDLTIQKLPSKAKLFMLIGPNGCGKSSVLDAIKFWHLDHTGYGSWEEDYHSKPSSEHDSHKGEAVSMEFFDPIPTENKKVVHVRSAYRNDPATKISSLTKIKDPSSPRRISKMIDNDAAVFLNYQILAGKVFEDVFNPTDGSISVDELSKALIGDIRDTLKDLFPDLLLDALENPLEDGTFRFTKGISKGFMFKNLSSGEKAAFDLILDLIVSRHFHDNTLFCIDEPESHMNAKLQAELLSALYRLIPNNCQLILATHSIGMMRRARDIKNKNPESVVFLDFGDRDFDKPVVIEPSELNRRFWEKAHQVALDDLASLIAPQKIVICEGHPLTKKPTQNHFHDAKCYNKIFEAEFPETEFVSMGSDQDVLGDKHALHQTLLHLFNGKVEVVRLVDRDDRSEEQRDDLQKEGVRVLSLRNLESYLFDDEVLVALAESKGQEDKIQELLTAKKSILRNYNDIAGDNLKPVSGKLYNKCKQILNLTQVGSNHKSFMRDTLAPIITSEMNVYKKLKRDIFGQHL